MEREELLRLAGTGRLLPERALMRRANRFSGRFDDPHGTKAGLKALFAERGLPVPEEAVTDPCAPDYRGDLACAD